MYDISIIGAGVVGAAIARELAKYDLDVCLLEKESDVSTGASKANSGIVHGGYVGEAGTLKGELCIKGNSMYQQLDEELNFGYQNDGAIVVGFNEQDEKKLEEIYANALEVGHDEDDIEIIYGEKIREIEPHVNDDVEVAFHCKSVGVTSPFEMVIALVENAVDNGVTLRLESEVVDIDKEEDYFTVKTTQGDIDSKYVVNATGVHADKIAGMLGVDDFNIFARRGEYIVFSKEEGDLANTTIFQTPNEKTKGVLATTTVHGNFMIGPNAEDIDKKEDVATTRKEFEYIVDTARKSIPDFNLDQALTTFAGVRAKSDRGDFIIEESDIAGFINVAGIDSPGLTSSPAIAKKVVNILDETGVVLEKDPSFDPYREAIAIEKGSEFTGEIDHDEPSKNIICRCENVTKSEILDALNRSIPIKTTDAVKRRTRVKTGGCQGNFCESRVKEIIAEELDIPQSEVENRDEDNVPQRVDITSIRGHRMFCYQCQEAGGGTGCIAKGVCGKEEKTANLQDLLIYMLKGLSIITTKAKEFGIETPQADHLIIKSLFMTISNANFDDKSFIEEIKKAIKSRDKIRAKAEAAGAEFDSDLYGAVTWQGETKRDFMEQAKQVGVLQTMDEDIRSLREMITYGLKGIAAYSKHAYNLGYKEQEIYDFIQETLVDITDDGLTVDDLVALTMKTGDYGVKAMAQLDKANTETYGAPEVSEVNLGTRNNPGILISGHDLRDMEQLLEQTAGTGVDVYTHSEMLPANYYPAFKEYDHFVGNYGNSWWRQREEFETFNGPILFTTNCIVPPWAESSYEDDIFTTGATGFPGATHIEADENGEKDFSELIALAQKCEAPEEIETGSIVGGFAHNQVMKLADEVIEAVKSGAIKEFFVMAGCDGRFKEREYYTEFAKELPEDTVILTAGCAKYKYNKLDLGDINGIPRILDAGQCNDSYSLAVIAMKLQEAFDLDDINELPISYNIAWYEQKAVIVLLSLLSLGVKDIKLGPTLPAFLSENVANVLVEQFGITTIGEVESDMAEFLND